VPDIAAAAVNLGNKALRRLLALHKPLVRHARRRERQREHAAILDQALAAEPALAQIAAGTGPVIAGPWLAEVGYESMYWVPFLRWVQDRFRLPSSRLVVLSRGGVGGWYTGIADRYVDIFDHVTPPDLAARNAQRQEASENGGRKQTSITALDEALLAIARREVGADTATVLHPSLLFQLFRDVWLGNLPAEFLWARTEYAMLPKPPRPAIPGLPDTYVAVKFYSGVALPDSPLNRSTLRGMVESIAARTPVVVLDTGLAVDDHGDYAFSGIPNVVSARSWMTPQTNLGVQTALIAHASQYVATCGGLAWMAPFLGVPTVAVYSDDRLLGSHLMLARQAARQVGAADFMPLDVRALGALGAALR
jgi:hypothetical protein